MFEKAYMNDKKSPKIQRQQVCPNNCTASSGVDEKGGTARAPVNATVCKQRQSRFSGFVGDGNRQNYAKGQSQSGNRQQATGNRQQAIIHII